MMQLRKILIFSLVSIMFFTSCKKNDKISKDGGGADNPGDNTPPEDPETPATIGFFMKDWDAKTFALPGTSDAAKPTGNSTVTIEIDASKIEAKIPNSLFGQNSVSYVQNISNADPLMGYLKDLNVNTIRFPGGAISDTYFWDATFNTKPADAPDLLYINGQEQQWTYNYWYGKGNSGNRANLSDYYALLQKTGSNGMITVNYGYARYGLSDHPVEQAAHYAADWVRYDNGRTKYWEIGNENYGSWEKGFQINTSNNKDGQPEKLTGKVYAQQAKVFMDSMRKAAKEIGKDIYIGVNVIAEQEDWLWNNSPQAPTWNMFVMNEMKSNGADFYSIHSYFVQNGENTFEKIMASAENKTGALIKYVKDAMNKHGLPLKPVSLTEYNIYATGSAGAKQQVSFVNGMHTTVVLCEAIENGMGSALRWDISNGWDGGADHGMFNSGDEPGTAKWSPRPVFYYMYYLQKMLGDRMLPSTSSNKNVLSYASSFSSGEKGVVLVNLNRKQEIVKIKTDNASIGKKYYWYALTGGSDNNDFSLKVFVNGEGPLAPAVGGPVTSYKTLKAKTASTNDGVTIALPSRAVTFVVMDK